MSTWREVNPEDVVEGKGGSMWEVLAVDWPDVRLRSTLTDKQHVGQPDPDSPVVFVVKRTTRAQAVATVGDLLGGTDVAHQNVIGEWLTPAVFVHPGVLLTHLLAFHDKDYGAAAEEDDQSIEHLTAVHHDLHQQNVPPRVMHVHDPKYAEERV